ncbi:hypothetical protein [Streptomyces sp. NBC_00370]|uniref:hypothetical protein n=1 Tax=Streptomyces sp. NBC_00370 TaxID=2975728 RepID=UPI002E272C81
MKTVRHVVAVLLLVMVAGCGLQSDADHVEKDRRGMNMQAAANQADMILQQTLSGIMPELRWNHGPSNESICTDFKNGSRGTGSVKRRIAVMTVVSEARRGNLLGVVERNWKTRGYRITSVDDDKDLPAIFASTPEDFRMRVAVGGRGQFFFSITTPCFRESPVSAPATAPNTPDRAGEYPQPPDVQDDFWSSSEPLASSSPGTP